MIFSVIVPFLNEEKYIERCVKSLLAQNFDKNEYELIFVDNGSTDGSANIIKRYPSATLLYESKKYEYACRNRGIVASKGRIIVSTNADCAVSGDWLQSIYEDLKRSGADIVIGRVQYPGDLKIFRMIEEYEHLKAQYVFTGSEKRYFYGNANNMAVKKEIFEKIGLYSESRRSGDTELIKRYLSDYPNAKISYAPEASVIHLEVDTLHMWLKRASTAAMTNARLNEMTDFTPLELNKNIIIYTRCVKGYNIIQKASLLFLLICSYVCYKAGELKGRISVDRG